MVPIKCPSAYFEVDYIPPHDFKAVRYELHTVEKKKIMATLKHEKQKSNATLLYSRAHTTGGGGY